MDWILDIHIYPQQNCCCAKDITMSGFASIFSKNFMVFGFPNGP